MHNRKSPQVFTLVRIHIQQVTEIKRKRRTRIDAAAQKPADGLVHRVVAADILGGKERLSPYGGEQRHVEAASAAVELRLRELGDLLSHERRADAPLHCQRPEIGLGRPSFESDLHPASAGRDFFDIAIR